MVEKQAHSILSIKLLWKKMTYNSLKLQVSSLCLASYVSKAGVLRCNLHIVNDPLQVYSLVSLINAYSFVTTVPIKMFPSL